MSSPAARSRALEAHQRLAKALTSYQSTLRDQKGEVFSKGFELFISFEFLVGELYRVRSGFSKNDPFRRQFEDLASSAIQDVFNSQSLIFQKKRESPYVEWLRNYRRIWREHFPLFLVATIPFLIACIVGWSVVTMRPDLAPVLIPDGLIEKILDHQAWFESAGKQPFITGLQIAANNIGVCIKSYVGGALLGFGGLLILVFNGVHFGSIFAFCANNQFDDALAGFVVSHGPLELTMIIASAFSSFIFGRVFWMRPIAHLKKRMGLAGVESLIVLSGILPWVAFAACFEVLVSPSESFDYSQKLTLGLGIAFAFWLWTFWPDPVLKKIKS